MTPQPPSRQPSLEQLVAIAERVGRLLHDVELAFPENPQGTYPSEVEMTLRLAYTTVLRAVKQERQSEQEMGRVAA